MRALHYPCGVCEDLQAPHTCGKRLLIERAYDAAIAAAAEVVEDAAFGNQSVPQVRLAILEGLRALAGGGHE